MRSNINPLYLSLLQFSSLQPALAIRKSANSSVAPSMTSCDSFSRIYSGKSAESQLVKAMKKYDSFTRMRFGTNFEAPAPTPSMDQFIGQDYHDHETEHAGFILANALQVAILTSIDMDQNYQPCMYPHVLEIGCSSGTSTKPMLEGLARFERKELEEQQELARILGSQTETAIDERLSWLRRYDAIDIDQGAIQRLNFDLQRLKQDKGDNVYTHCSSKVKAMVADAMRYIPKGKAYTNAVMQFALSHFDAAGKSYLLDHLSKIVDLGGTKVYPEHEINSIEHNLIGRGTIIVTDEFLPRYTNDQGEQDALCKHHGAVIYDALIKGNYRLAELELEALYSGLHKIGDFKISCHEFEDVLWRKGMEAVKFKTFPLVGDLIPQPEANMPKTATEKERQANQLWIEHSAKIFDAVKANKPTPGNLQLPQAPRDALHKIIETFKSSQISHLRPTLKPGDVQLNYRDFPTYDVTYKQEFQEEWGVYTYKIRFDVNDAANRKRHQEFSYIAESCNTPEKMAGTILEKWTGKDLKYQDEIEWSNSMWRHKPSQEEYLQEFVFACLDDIDRPANRWHFAMGDVIPTYHQLNHSGSATNWQEKVDFSKKALQIVVDRILAEHSELVIPNYVNGDNHLGALVTEYNELTKRTHISRSELLRNLLVFHPY